MGRQFFWGKVIDLQKKGARRDQGNVAGPSACHWANEYAREGQQNRAIGRYWTNEYAREGQQDNTPINDSPIQRLNVPPIETK